MGHGKKCVNLHTLILRNLNIKGNDHGIKCVILHSGDKWARDSVFLL